MVLKTVAHVAHYYNKTAVLGVYWGIGDEQLMKFSSLLRRNLPHKREMTNGGKIDVNAISFITFDLKNKTNTRTK